MSKIDMAKIKFTAKVPQQIVVLGIRSVFVSLKDIEIEDTAFRQGTIDNKPAQFLDTTEATLLRVKAADVSAKTASFLDNW